MLRIASKRKERVGKLYVKVYVDLSFELVN